MSVGYTTLQLSATRQDAGSLFSDAYIWSQERKQTLI
jgi:hypothetical protein